MRYKYIIFWYLSNHTEREASENWWHMETNIGLGGSNSFSTRAGWVNTHPSSWVTCWEAAVAAKINVEMFDCILWSKMSSIES